jgi:hypothetical protein
MSKLNELFHSILSKFTKPSFIRRVHYERSLYIKQPCLIRVSKGQEVDLEVYVISTSDQKIIEKAELDKNQCN